MKVVLVTYGLINRQVALELRRRGHQVVVFEDSELWAEMAREDGMECEECLVSDPEAEGALVGAEAFVLMDVDALRVDRLAKSFRRKFPKARIIAPDVGIQELPFLETFTGEGNALRIGQDSIVHAVVSAVEDHMAKRTTDHLVEAMQAGGGTEVAVFTHDDPDPDAIAAGMGILRICEHLGLDAKLYHGGRLARLENRFFARLVEAPLNRVDQEEAAIVIQQVSRVVLVDVGRPGEHNSLPPDTVPNIVLDHHSTNREVCAADYCDVRPGVGSTSTMVTLHLQDLGIVPDARLAACLLYGIRTDTDRLRRNASTADMRASAYLSSLADQTLMDMVENPPLSEGVVDVIGRGIAGRTRVGDHVLSWCGVVGSRDDLPHVADFLLGEEDVAAVFVFGQVEDRIHISARSVTGGPHVGEIVKEAVGDIGSGGGHATMAGGSVNLLTGVDLDVDEWVRKELFQAFIHVSGVDR
ncbi:MAG: DHH family phosphoesterase [Thermoplasmata archaeon]|nr:MAG: DHH family phosphoesterase [Thermoplasmata archaeon]